MTSIPQPKRGKPRALSPEQELEVLEHFNSGASMQSIAKYYNISNPTVKAIIIRNS